MLLAGSSHIDSSQSHRHCCRRNRSGARVHASDRIQVVDSKDSGDRLFLASRRGGGGRRDHKVCTVTHHHDYHRHRSSSCRPRIPVLAAVAVAVYALPLFAGVTAGLATYHSGSGPIGAIIVGLIASTITLIAGQIAFRYCARPLLAQESRSSSQCRPPSRDIMPHLASRTLVSPLRAGDRQWH
jgi:hypothetical protein